MVGENGKLVNVFGLAMITVDAGGNSYGVVYPGATTQNIINYINDKMMDDKYWDTDSDTTRDAMRDILTSKFGGELTLDDVFNRSKEVYEFFDQLPENFKDGIIILGGEYTRNE